MTRDTFTVPSRSPDPLSSKSSAAMAYFFSCVAAGVRFVETIVIAYLFSCVAAGVRFGEAVIAYSLSCELAGVRFGVAVGVVELESQGTFEHESEYKAGVEEKGRRNESEVQTRRGGVMGPVFTCGGGERGLSIMFD